MSKIQVLDTHLTNMIAAGEVVERPAGIIKELIENSIDAKATQIEVTIVEGGMTSLEVSDNGEGMDAEDLKRAFERHSTSKIKNVIDLNSISSFGFRGEALPSIASVSHVEALTHDGKHGNKIIIDNGKILEASRAARNPGTTISVSSLFLKTPARLKHIKNIHYETSIILDTIQKFALGNPNVAFSLVNEGKVSFRSYGNGDILDVFHRIYGTAVSSDSQTFSAENYDFKIDGVMALPQHNRANRYAIWLYINNRMIRFPKLQKAIVDGYRRHMPTDRYPIVAMNITVDPQLVDVNVHPSKWEIRLSKDNVLIELIQSSFEDILGTSMRPQKLTIKPSEPEQFDFKSQLEGNDVFVRTPQNNDILIEESEDQSLNTSINSELPLYDFKPRNREEAFEVLDDIKEYIPSPVKDIQGDTEEVYIDSDQKLKTESRIEPLKVLSQMSGCYILAQGDSGLYIIDQHAAMERVRYEFFQKKLLDEKHPNQDFLIPLMIEGRAQIIPYVNDVNKVMETFQMKLEIFSDDTLIIRSHPMWIKETEIHEFVNNVLDQFESEKTIREEDLRRNAIATLACHSSVRFNEYMSMEAMIELVAQLRDCEQPFHCPHGRPTFITVEHKQLIREFKR